MSVLCQLKKWTKMTRNCEKALWNCGHFRVQKCTHFLFRRMKVISAVSRLFRSRSNRLVKELPESNLNQYKKRNNCRWEDCVHTTYSIAAEPTTESPKIPKMASPESRCGNIGFRCVVAERYILQQKCLKKWIGSAVVGTRWYNLKVNVEKEY